MDEFACVKLLSKIDESSQSFRSRLISFWTHMLRTNPSEYERVYAESAEMERLGTRSLRRYLIGIEIVGVLQQQLDAAGIDHDPIDTDDLYSKYEASPPEWFQVPH